MWNLTYCRLRAGRQRFRGYSDTTYNPRKFVVSGWGGHVEGRAGLGTVTEHRTVWGGQGWPLGGGDP